MENTTIRPESALEFAAQGPLTAEFLVGSWRVNPMLNRIEGARPDTLEPDQTVARSLEPRLMHLLCYLAANPSRVLTRDELIQELWPDVIVNENSLTRAVSELRKQLSTTQSKVNDYIETIPKRGYRLTARLALPSSIETEPPHTKIVSDLMPAMLPGKSPPTLRVPGQRAPLAVTVCLALVVSLVLWQWAPSPATDDAMIPIVTAQLSDEVIGREHNWLGGKITLSNSVEEGSTSELEKLVAVSNDQQKLAFIQQSSKSSTIFVTSVDNLAMAYPVFSSDEKLYNLRWSPVGESLLFASKPKLLTTALFSTSPDTAKLMMVDVNTLKSVVLINEKSEPESGEVMSLT